MYDYICVKNIIIYVLIYIFIYAYILYIYSISFIIYTVSFNSIHPNISKKLIEILKNILKYFEILDFKRFFLD